MQTAVLPHTGRDGNFTLVPETLRRLLHRET